MKKLFLSLSFIILSLAMFCSWANAIECLEFNGSNTSAQNYIKWSSPVQSYLVSTDNAELMRVQYVSSSGDILVEYYDPDYNVLSRKIVKCELPIFGGFFSCDNGYYIVTGQRNPNEKDSEEVVRITKYDKSWNRLSSASLYGENTTIPFDSGSLRFAKSGKYIIIRTSHEMYKSQDDGKNHQSNFTIQLDSEQMVITACFSKVLNSNYGYVSHSFNQFVKIDRDNIIALDHGDAYPRSIVLIKYKTQVSSGNFVPNYRKTCTCIDMFPISGNIGDNSTNCSVGGFEISDSSYIVAISSVNQFSSSKVKNIYISALDENSDRPSVYKLTDYTDTDEPCSTPHLVKTGDNSFVVLWKKGKKLCFAQLDGKGNLKGEIKSFIGELSDCVPIISNGKLVWYVWNKNVVDFYEINLNNSLSLNKKTVNTFHSYKPQAVSGNTLTLVCTKCGSTKNGKLPNSFSIYWQSKNYSDMYVSAPESVYHPGETIKLQVQYSPADFNEYEILSSDKNVAKIICDSDGSWKVQTQNEGTAKITVRSIYNSNLKNDNTLKVSHSWVESENAATCTEDGTLTKVCSDCNKVVKETLPSLGHSYGTYTVTKEPTCTAQGKKTANCIRCNKEVSETISKINHDSKETVLGSKATCDKEGKTDGKKCSMCGKIMVVQEDIPMLGHSYGEYKITKEPTCTAQGKKTANCMRCNKEVSETISKINHDSKETVYGSKATCDKAGKTDGKKCSMCGKVMVAQEDIPMLGHSYGTYTVTKEPTCTAQGKKTANCIRCNKEVSETIAKINHDSKETVLGSKATCDKEGKTDGKKCSMCGKIMVVQEDIPMLGHSYGEYKITKEPTCTAQGKKTANCMRCNKEVSETISKINHDSKETVLGSKATCDKAGKTDGKKCSMCGKVMVAQEDIPMLGHSYGTYTVTKEPTCTAQGKKTANCMRCNKEVSETISKINHDSKETVLGSKATCDKAGKTDGKNCSMCGKVMVSQEDIPMLGHSYGTYTVTKEPTCTAQGKKTANCIRCNKEVSETIAKINHDSKEIVYGSKATCDKAGKTDGKKCSMCDKVMLAQEDIPMLGHSYGEYKITKDPTCTAQGEETAFCVRCSKSRTQPLSKLGNSYNDYIITKEPTCTAKGEKTAYCSRCNQTVTEDVEKLEHKQVTIKATKATCTKSGKTQGAKCSVCGKVLKQQETTEKLGHSYKSTVITKATKNNHGEIKEKCSRCGDEKTKKIYMIKTVKLNKTKYAYNGKAPTLSVSVIDSQKNALKLGEDYVVNIGSAKKIGTYTAKITFKGKYSGSEKLSFSIVVGKTSKISAKVSTTQIKLTWKEVKGATGYRVYQYDSKNKKYKLLTTVTGKNTYTVKKLKSGTTYKFSVKAYAKLSDGTVNWGSNVTAQFATKPAKTVLSVKSGSKSASLSWQKVSGASGYQIYYSTSKNGEYKKLKSITKLSYKKSELKSGKTYYFKVRAYKKVDSKVVYGAFSDIKSVKVK